MLLRECNSFSSPLRYPSRSGMASDHKNLSLLCAVFLSLTLPYIVATSEKASDEKETRVPTSCEVCRVLVHEMGEKMKATAAKLKLDLGSKLEGPDARRIDYSRSELRLIEVLDTACDKVGTYGVHVKDGMQRYAKQESDTLDALNSLRRRGVEVKIDIPWDVVDKQPNKEIMALKRKCEAIVEEYEDDLSAWYFQHQETSLTDYLCKERVLENEDQNCLTLPWSPYGERPPTTEDEIRGEYEEGQRKRKQWKEEELAGKKIDFGQKLEL